MTTDEEMKDILMGPIGTPERDRFEISCLMWEVGYGIKLKRKELNMSQEELAQKTGLTLRDIKGIERGNVTTHIPNIHKIWHTLGMHQPEPKSQSRKRPLTKQSPSLRTIAG